MTKRDIISEIIKVLEVKRLTKGLTKEEEKRYCKLNSELTGIPAKWFSKKMNDKMMNLINKSNALIKRIKK